MDLNSGKASAIKVSWVSLLFVLAMRFRRRERIAQGGIKRRKELKNTPWLEWLFANGCSLSSTVGEKLEGRKTIRLSIVYAHSTNSSLPIRFLVQRDIYIRYAAPTWRSTYSRICGIQACIEALDSCLARLILKSTVPNCNSYTPIVTMSTLNPGTSNNWTNNQCYSECNSHENGIYKLMSPPISSFETMDEKR